MERDITQFKALITIGSEHNALRRKFIIDDNAIVVIKEGPWIEILHDFESMLLNLNILNVVQAI